MGYILPITQHTYINYHARMLESKKSPYYIGELYKVSFNTVHDDEHNPYNEGQWYEVQDEKQTMHASKRHHPRSSQMSRYNVDQETKALLTGKGKLLNEQV